MTVESPDIDEREWLEARRRELSGYLEREGVAYARVAPRPTWYLAPYVSVWAVDSRHSPAAWWAVCGDHPTDYILAHGLDDARAVLRAFGERWLHASSLMLEGVPHPAMTIGSREDRPRLGDLLRRRAGIFIQWADDEGIWREEG